MVEKGLRIKETRIKRGLSQEDLAELSKVNLRTIQRIENNETTPKDKTLKLIYDALDIVVIENEKIKIDKYTVWTSLLTIFIIGSTFINWLGFTIGYSNGKRIYKSFNGWNESAMFNDYDFPNWLPSISAITIGFIVISHSLGLLKNKFKYIITQLTIIVLYLLGVIGWSFRQGFELKPGLFIIVIATVLLIISYRKKDRTTGANRIDGSASIS